MFSTRWFSLTGPILGLFLSAGLSVSARAQSVADAARVQRQKHAISELDAKKLFQAEADKPASNRTLRRGVITNDDLPADPQHFAIPYTCGWRFSLSNCRLHDATTVGSSGSALEAADFCSKDRDRLPTGTNRQAEFVRALCGS